MATSAGQVVRQVVSVFFEYDTPRIVHINSKTVGIINRFLQLCIIGYVIGYAIVWKKGYQDFGDLRSSVTTKVKGVVRVNLNNETIVMDVSDYVVPPQENGALFVTTNLIRTENQTQSKCPENPNMPKVLCNNDTECPANVPVVTGNGVRTGKCDKTVGVCEIYAWCPVENGSRPRQPLLAGSENFTVFIKNNIEFPKFKIKKRNLPDNKNDSYLWSCRYDRDADPQCPIFELWKIAGYSNNPYGSLAEEGAVIEVIITWDCNLDYSLDNCEPKYEFRRLDSSDYKISKGYNFRYANYYKEDGIEKRSLTKAYGILFIVNVVGRAGKFSIVPLLLNIGSGLALLSIATIICDVFVLYILKAKDLYYKKKYLTVRGSDAYTIMKEEPKELSNSDDIGGESVDGCRQRKESDAINK